jgi:uncharacterized membrane protein (DUF2068 family)
VHKRIDFTSGLILMKARLFRLFQDRPIGLIAIVAYKVTVTAIFSLAAISLLISAREYNALQALADQFKLAGKHRIIEWILTTLLNFSSQRIGFVGAASGVYALISGIEAIGLWQRRVWAHWLVISLVAMGILPELYEISRGVTPIKAVVMMVNVLMLGYLLTHRPRHH